MAVTHHWNDDDDFTQGGYWTHDYGQKIKSRTDEKLKNRLPRMAIEMAERIRNEKYDF